MAADVAATLPLWSTTEGSNSPSGSTSVSTNLDDNLRMIQKVVRGWLATKGADIASAGTTDLGAVEGLAHDITGTTTITSFGTVAAGIIKVLKFEGALTLTHNATSLIIPGGANITTADGDVALVISEGSGNWRVLSYFTAASLYVTAAGTATLTNKTLTTPTITAPVINSGIEINGAISGDAIAAQAEMETGTATDSIVTPGNLVYHQAACKGWVMAAADGTAAASYNVTSVGDNGAGDVSINWGTDISGNSYCAVGAAKSDAILIFNIANSSFTGGVTRGFSRNLSSAGTDPNHWMFAIFGDFA